MNADEYEEFVRQVLQSMDQGKGIVLHHRQAYTGRISEREIVVDVSFETHVLNMRLLFLVECKHYARRVAVEDVEEFHSKIDDIGAHKGLMVTTVGYQEGAVKTAKGRGIALALLTDTPLPGEIMMVGNSLDDQAPKPDPSDIFRGNLKTVQIPDLRPGNNGFRFNSFTEMLGILVTNMPEYMKALNALRQQPPEDEK